MKYFNEQDEYEFQKTMLKAKGKNNLERAEHPTLERAFLETESIVIFIQKSLRIFLQKNIPL